MVSDILRSVQASEKEAEKIIAEAKQEAKQIKARAVEEIAAKRNSDADSFGQDAEKRRQAVREEEERKDKEHALKIGEELEVLAREAATKEDAIVSELAKRVYAL